MSDPNWTIELTLYETDGPLTKSLSLDDAGGLKSIRAPTMVTGRAERVTAASFTEIGALIESTQSNQALGLGALRAELPERVRIVTKQKLEALNGKAAPDRISRSAEYFEYRPHHPAFALFDVDTKGMPDAVQNAVAALGGFLPALEVVLPVMRTAGHAVRASTSSGLSRSDTGTPIAGSTGQHIYVGLVDGSDARRFLQVTHERAWLAGFGWLVVSKAGTLLERSLIDRTVFAPERLAFEGSPVLALPLVQSSEGRKCRVQDGPLIDSRQACPDLTDAERVMFAELRAAEVLRLTDAASAAKAKFIEERAPNIVTRMGCSLAAAREVAARWSAGVLTSGVDLPFDAKKFHGKTVGDVLADPDSYVGATLADPIEGPDYGIGTAKIMRRPDGTVWINSFAHGGVTYELKPAELDVGAELQRLSWMSSVDYARVRKPAAKMLGIGISDLDQAVKAEKAKRSRAAEAEARAKPKPEQGETHWPPGIAARADGLYATAGNEAEPLWLCAPLEVLGLARDADGESWGLWLKWRDADQRTHTWPMPAELLMIQSSELEASLVRRGLQINEDGGARTILRHALNGVKSGARVALADVPGWCVSQAGDRAFVLINGEVIGTTTEEIVLKAPPENAALKMAAAGTLEGWKSDVASKAAGNPVAAFAICMAFAGPLLEPLGESSGGIHFFGRSKVGKTLAMRIGISVWGPTRKNGLLKDWRSTTNALEAAAEECNDGFLALDEIHQAEAKDVVAGVYQLANEGGKQRLTREAVSKRRRTWRSIVMSTGEVDIATMAAKHSSSPLPAGAEVRLPSIPIDGRDMWPNLHGEDSALALMVSLQQALLTHYGTAIRTFLRDLTACLAENDGFLDKTAEELRTQFYNHLPEGADGQVKEVARRCALIALAGEIATEWQILPWQTGEAIAAAETILDWWINRRGGTGATEVSQHVKAVRAYLSEFGSSRFVALDPKMENERVTGWIERYPDRTIISRSGWRRPLVVKVTDEFGTERGKVVGDEYLLDADGWQKLCAVSGADPGEIAKTLHAGKHLDPGEGRNLAKRVRLPNVGLIRCYVVKPTIFAEIDEKEPEADE